MPAMLLQRECLQVAAEERELQFLADGLGKT